MTVVFIYTTDSAAGEGAEAVLAREGYDGSVTLVNGFQFIEDCSQTICNRTSLLTAVVRSGTSRESPWRHRISWDVPVNTVQVPTWKPIDNRC